MISLLQQECITHGGAICASDIDEVPIILSIKYLPKHPKVLANLRQSLLSSIITKAEECTASAKFAYLYFRFPHDKVHLPL